MRPRAKTNLEKMGFVDPDRKESKHDVLQLQILENPEKLIKGITEKEITDLKVETIKLEYPVVTSTKFIVGYLDCVISFSFDEGKFYETSKYERVDGVRKEVITRKKERTYITLCVEIKTKIESFGDTLRQINTYKQYVGKYPNPHGTVYFVVASEDDRYKPQFESQNIRFYNFK